MTLKDMLLCGAFAVALPIGQLLFKWAAIHNASQQGPFLLRVLQNYPLMGAFAWYAATALFWFYVLTRTPLSTAYAFSLIGSALVPLAAWLIFKEPVSVGMAAGYAMMLAGFFIILMQVRA
ncbi:MULTISPECIES: DMT family transporter [Phenylobacterium]|uniref:Multidrug transporter EmrE-like cation transporter n=1 Tax=Phenylobacterium koreense TaxID=266125 RepID=A0ABV2EJA5_9CAUL